MFLQKTKRTGLYNIQSIDNIPSIIRNGLLSNELAEGIHHTSIAMNVVQAKRDVKKIPNGLKLHQYANLYFDYWNPMLSAKRSLNESICILKFDPIILDFEGVIVSDRNASSDYAAFYPINEGLDILDFNMVYDEEWTNANTQVEMWIKKSVKCSEVLVPYCIPYDYIVSAAVFNEKSAEMLFSMGFDRKIIVNSKYFF